MAGEVERLSGKLGLDTTDFKVALGAANRELRVLESGFKASAAALGDWTKDATGLESRVKSLTGQIDIQKSKVDALRAEHERLVEANGANSRAAQDAEIKLNKETETLGKMQVELNGTEEALQEMESGEEEAGDAAEDMGEQVDESGAKVEGFKGVLAGMGVVAAGVVTAVAAVGAAALAAVAGISALVFKASEAAAELVDMSAKTGISTTRLQELSFIGEQVGTSLDTITGAQARLVRSMFSATEQQQKFDEALAEGKSEDEIPIGDLAVAFNTLRVSTMDANGELRDSQAVFDDVIDALGKIQNPTERDALAMQIFGKSAQELNPLIKAGSDEMARLAKEAHDVGAVMSEEDVAALEEFDDTMASVKAGIKGMLGSLATEFLPIFKQVAGGLKDLFKSEDFKRRIQEFSQLLKGFVEVMGVVLKQILSGDIKGALTTMFGADRADQLLNLFNAVRSFIFDTLIPFINTHGEAIKSILIAIVAGLAAFAIIGTVVGWITGLIATITALSGAFVAAGGGIAGIIAILGGPVTLVVAAVAAAIALLAAAWAGNWFGIRDTLTKIWEGFLKPTFETLRNWLSVTIPAVLRALSSMWTGTLLPAIQAVWSFLNGSIFPLLRAIGEFIGAVFNLYVRVMAGLWQNVLLPALQAAWGFLDANVFPIFRAIGDYISGKLQPIFSTLAGFLRSSLTPAFEGIARAIESVIRFLQGMAERLNSLKLPTWLTPRSPTPWEIGLIGINDAMRELNSQLPVMAMGLNQVAFAGASGAGGPSQISNASTQNDNFAFYAPVIVQGSTPPQSLGARLKGRRY